MKRIAATKADKTSWKKCGRCHKRKCLDDFHLANARKDKRQPWCRKCMNKVMRKVQREKAAELRTFRLLKSLISVAEQEAATNG